VLSPSSEGGPEPDDVVTGRSEVEDQSESDTVVGAALAVLEELEELEELETASGGGW